MAEGGAPVLYHPARRGGAGEVVEQAAGLGAAGPERGGAHAVIVADKGMLASSAQAGCSADLKGMPQQDPYNCVSDEAEVDSSPGVLLWRTPGADPLTGCIHLLYTNTHTSAIP